MRRKLFLAILLTLLLSVMFIGTAFADHPDASDGGITTALDNAGEDAQAGGVFVTAPEKSGGSNGNGVAQQPAHNPICGGHPGP